MINWDIFGKNVITTCQFSYHAECTNSVLWLALEKKFGTFTNSKIHPENKNKNKKHRNIFMIMIYIPIIGPQVNSPIFGVHTQKEKSKNIETTPGTKKKKEKIG